MTLPAFEVDREGLAKILARRGIEFAVLELLQNALDEETTTITVSLRQLEGRRGRYMLRVIDDCPEGFKDLSHAYTLFAESAKTKNPEQRGRFNLGEKLVIAVCEEASIETTTGCVVFEGKTRHHVRRRRERGSEFSGILKLSPEEYKRVCRAVRSVLMPPQVDVRFHTNESEVLLDPREPVVVVEETLPTEIADADGYLRATARKTQVEIHEPREGEIAMLYEMGIPVVETGDRFHVNVLQKVPLNADRDNVTPSYLRQLRTVVLNATHGMLSAEDAKATWVTTALQDEDVAPEAVQQVMTARYGEKRVIFDPTDPEGTKIAVSKGYTVIHGGSLPLAAWDNIRKTGAALPAGQVTPSPRVFSPDGKPLKTLGDDEMTDDQRSQVDFCQRLHARLIGGYLHVTIANDIKWPFGACYGRNSLTLNLGRLGHNWFEAPAHDPRVLKLLLHEFAHAKVSDHLSHEFHEEVAVLGARAVEAALATPDLFEKRKV